MGRRDALQRVDRDFVKTLDELFPNARSVREKTQRLNERLTEMLYGEGRNAKVVKKKENRR